MKRLRKNNVYIVVVISAFVLFSQNAKAYMFEWEGTNTYSGNYVNVAADLTIDGDTLTIDLYNLAEETLTPADALTGLYFDFVGGADPTLTGLLSATGDLFRGVASADGPDVLLGTDLLTTADPAYSTSDPPWWVAKTMDSDFAPGYDYGIGAAGYADFSPPNGFPGSTDGPNGGIIAKDFDIETANLLNNGPLVKYMASFDLTFASGSLAGLSIERVLFGFGSRPDFYVPLPGAVLLGMLGLGVAGIKLRKYT